MNRDWKTAAIGLVSLGFAQLSAAAGTPAGTAIDNTAVINYEVGGSSAGRQPLVRCRPKYAK